MTYVELEYKFTPVGKRKPVSRCSEHDISDNLWFALCMMAESNGFCSVGKYDWNDGVLYISRGGGVDETYKKHCNSPADWKLYEETRKTMNYELREMKYKYEYTAKVLSVNEENKTALVQQFATRKMVEQGIYEGKTYTINISDKCIYDGIKAKDTILIRKFINNQFLGVSIFEVYEEPSYDDVEDATDLDFILGDY